MSVEDYPDKVLQQQEAIRRSGLTNMYDMSAVKRIADEMGSYELVDFLDDCAADEYIDMAEAAREHAEQ